MRILITAGLTLCLIASAVAKELTLTLSDDEQRALVQILDTANKAGGLSNIETVLYFLKKLQAAQTALSVDPAKLKE